MSTGRMLEQEIDRTDALTRRLERIYAYLESVCPPDFVVEVQRAAEGDLAEDGEGHKRGQFQGAARPVAEPALTRPEAALNEQIAEALRSLCYVPGHYEEIRHLNYCRWCHFEESHPHSEHCVMSLLEPQSRSAT